MAQSTHHKEWAWKQPSARFGSLCQWSVSCSHDFTKLGGTSYDWWLQVCFKCSSNPKFFVWTFRFLTNLDHYVLFCRHLYSVSVESGVVMGLDGAIQRVIINGETTVNLLRKAIDSKNIRDYKGAPCAGNPCENDGICVPNFRKPVCICRRGFRGKYCKQRDTG